MDRVENITINEEEKRREEKRVKEELQMNGYPARLVDRVKFKRERSRARDKKKEQPGKEKITATCTIPYVRCVSEAVSRILTPLGIRTVMKPAKRKWILMKGVKDRQPKECQPGVVYALGCAECPKVYIGETCRTVKQRIKEHADHTKKGYSEKSAVAKHVVDTNHQIYWKPRVLKMEQRTTERKVHESLAIHALNKRGGEKLMNQNTGMELSSIWFQS